MPRPRRAIQYLACLPGLAWLPPRAPLAAEEARPPFEKLLQLNAEKIFGGEVQVEGESITIRYKKPGQFNRGFEGSGIVNPEEIKGEASRKILENPEGGGAIPHVAVVGRGDGEWQSRFELTGDVKVTFKLRIPSIQKGAQLNIWLHKTAKCYVHTSFFQTAIVHGGGKNKRATAAKEYLGPPDKWFDKKALVPVELSLKEGKFSLKLKDAPVITLEEAVEAPGGRLALGFRKLAFVLSDLAISGKIDRTWCEGQLKELETKGELAVKEKPPPPESNPPRKSAKKEDEKTQREKDAEVDL